jgi:hypothetical protein
VDVTSGDLGGDMAISADEVNETPGDTWLVVEVIPADVGGI